MAKYYRNSQLENKKMFAGARLEVFEIDQVDENTQIETDRGVLLVTPGNYVVTAPDGSKVGLAEADLAVNYTEIKD
jgi:hypothetical protein